MCSRTPASDGGLREQELRLRSNGEEVSAGLHEALLQEELIGWAAGASTFAGLRRPLRRYQRTRGMPTERIVRSHRGIHR
jgi:hypothetical protein